MRKIKKCIGIAAFTIGLFATTSDFALTAAEEQRPPEDTGIAAMTRNMETLRS